MALTLEAIGSLFDKKLKVLKKELIEDGDIKMNTLTNIINKQAEKITNLEETLNIQDEIIIQHTRTLTKYEKRMSELEETIDDQINRNMRNNLVIKGIVEENNESWSSTKSLVCDVLSRHLQMDNTLTSNTIERAHRGGKKHPKKIRHIYMKLFSTEDVKY